MVENIYRRLAESDERPGDMIGIIRDAAAEVDRPLFYSVAVIVVSFLPIYVLSGPSGVLFKPMADTMIFALVGSLHRHFDLASGALLLADAERRSRTAQCRLRAHPRRLCTGPRSRLARPLGTIAASALLLLASLLLFADVGAEFMPHLDEGALWVRATMPYTISFDESAKIVPQVRSILVRFPK